MSDIEDTEKNSEISEEENNDMSDDELEEVDFNMNDLKNINDDDDDDMQSGGEQSDDEDIQSDNENNDDTENEYNDENDDDNLVNTDEENDINNSDDDSLSALITKKTNTQQNALLQEIEEESDDESVDENYLQKFKKQVNTDYLEKFHPEILFNNHQEIQTLVQITRDKKTGIIIDDFHKTIPILTKYEKTRILGQRAKQINSGAKPFVKVPANIIEGKIIAELELNSKKIPFIIKRPLPNGSFEYWRVEDLQLI